MKRTVITAEIISVAHNKGETLLAVPYSSVITPAAGDMAASLGITVQRESPALCRTSRTAKPSPVSASCPNKDQERGAQAAGNQDDPPPFPDDAARAPSPPQTGRNAREPSGVDPQLFDDIKQRVLARLPAALHTHPLLDELLRKSLIALCAREQNPAHTPVPDIPPAQECLVAATALKTATAWKQSAGEAFCVTGSALPWQTSSPGKAVNVIDTVGAEGAAFAAGYMEWEDASFGWTLERNELFIVLRGELRVRVAGETLKAGPGDMLYLSQGAEAEFSSSGHVRAAYAACSSCGQSGR